MATVFSTQLPYSSPGVILPRAILTSKRHYLRVFEPLLGVRGGRLFWLASTFPIWENEREIRGRRVPMKCLALTKSFRTRDGEMRNSTCYLMEH